MSVAILACVFLSILFSASETALNALGRSRLEKVLDAIRESGEHHRFLDVWATRRNDALILILIGNNVVNISASALATVLFEGLMPGGTGVGVAIFVVTLLILTFGEIIPKTYAQNNATRFLPVTRALYPFWIFCWRLGLVKSFRWLSESLIRKFGGATEQMEHEVTEEDIEDQLERAVEQGNLDQDRAKLVTSALDFVGTSTREVMTPRTEVVGLTQDQTLDEACAVIVDSRYSRYPVFGESRDEVIGVVHVRDVLSATRAAVQPPVKLSELWSEPFVVTAYQSISEVLRGMQAKRMHLAVVYDEHGGVAGIVTVEDIIEEVFGEIYDEHDDAGAVEGEDLVRQVGELSWDMDAKVQIRDLEDAVDVEVEGDESYSTVAGLILAEVGGLPDPGVTVTKDGLIYTVLECDDTRIVRVRVDRIEGDPVIDPTAVLDVAS